MHAWRGGEEESTCTHTCMHWCTPVDNCGSQRSRSHALPSHSSALFLRAKSLISLVPTNQSSPQVPGSSCLCLLALELQVTGFLSECWVSNQYSRLCTSPLLLPRETLFLTNKNYAKSCGSPPLLVCNEETQTPKWITEHRAWPLSEQEPLYWNHETE